MIHAIYYQSNSLQVLSIIPVLPQTVPRQQVNYIVFINAHNNVDIVKYRLRKIVHKMCQNALKIVIVVLDYDNRNNRGEL
jgi:ABC-type cobalamin transport system ATPase subunit